MAYIYNDWATLATPAAQLARLNLHIAEVSFQMGPDVAADGKSKSVGSLQGYLAMLTAQRDKLLADPLLGPVVQRARLSRPR